MTPKEAAAARSAELRGLIERCNYEYHVLDNPTLEDFEYDALTRELRAIEAEYPELATAVCLAKKDHIVDDFVYASVSPAYLSAMMDTL